MCLQLAKLFDAALASLLLVVFTAVPVALLLSDARLRESLTPLRMATVAAAALSWPLYLGAAAMLLPLFRGVARGGGGSGGNGDEAGADAQAIFRKLGIALGALVATLCGSLCVLVAVALALGERVRDSSSGGVSALLGVDAVCVVFVVVVCVLLIRLFLEVRGARIAARGGGEGGSGTLESGGVLRLSIVCGHVVLFADEGKEAVVRRASRRASSVSFKDQDEVMTGEIVGKETVQI